MVRAPAPRTTDLGSILVFLEISLLCYTSDSLVAARTGALRYRVSAGTGWPDISTLSLDEVESLICSFYLSAAARKLV